MGIPQSQNTSLIRRQRRLSLGAGLVAGMVVMISYAPSFIHVGALNWSPHAASRIRLCGLIIGLTIISCESGYTALAAWRTGRVITESRIVYRGSHRFEYRARLSVDVFMALLAPVLLIVLLFSGANVV